MTQSLTYVEIDIPPYPVFNEAAGFDGTYLSRGAGLTGAADSKQITASFWFRLDEQSGGNHVIIQGSVATVLRCEIGITDAGIPYLLLYNSAASLICFIFPLIFVAVGQWHHVLMSVDLADTNKRHIYVDDISSLFASTYTNDTADFTVDNWTIGADANGTQAFTGAIAALWVQTGLYIDLSVEANRRLFSTSGGIGAFLDSDGSEPTGSPPIIYLTGPETWHTNKGTGGGFTVVGAGLETVTDSLRFALPAAYRPNEIAAIPSLLDVKIDPTIISLGEDLGKRATVTARFRDHKYILFHEDYDSGTFWGKFRARYGLKLRTFPLRVITGFVGQSIEDMETRHFVIESTSGPNAKGEYQIVAKDVLKFADGDRAQAPLLSNGFLLADITNVATSLTLSPSGIGVEYPSGSPTNFYVNVGGNEIMLVTNRVTDTLTVTRGQFNTEAVSHTAGDRVQICIEYLADDVSDIIYELLVNYADVDPAFITLSDWTTETGTYLNQVYTALIAEPTSVNKLISELIEQAGLAMWWDDINQKIRLQVLKAVSTEADTYDEDVTLKDSLNVDEQPNKRISQVYTYFAKINPTVKEDQVNNYRSTAVTIDDDAEMEYGGPAIKKIFSRWIPTGGRAVAENLNNILLARFRDPPRQIRLDLMRYNSDADPILGTGYQIGSWMFQEPDGTAALVPAQLTQLKAKADIFELELEEVLWSPTTGGAGGGNSPGEHVIVYDSNLLNVNLRSTHDAIYGPPDATDHIICYVEAGITIGSLSTATPAFNVGSWPLANVIDIIVTGRIQGCGGNGGAGGFALAASGGNGVAGSAGGTALYTRVNIFLTSTNGEIWGGGGGGGGGGSFFNGDAEVATGGGGGGGGAGTNGGAGGAGGFGSAFSGNAGNPGTTEAGGAGAPGVGTGGTGGGPGLTGTAGTASVTAGGNGGAAGSAIDGDSFITDVGAAGDIRGAQVN